MRNLVITMLLLSPLAASAVTLEEAARSGDVCAKHPDLCKGGQRKAAPKKRAVHDDFADFENDDNAMDSRARQLSERAMQKRRPANSAAVSVPTVSPAVSFDSYMMNNAQHPALHGKVKGLDQSAFTQKVAGPTAPARPDPTVTIDTKDPFARTNGQMTSPAGSGTYPSNSSSSASVPASAPGPAPASTAAPITVPIPSAAEDGTGQ